MEMKCAMFPAIAGGNYLAGNPLLQ